MEVGRFMFEKWKSLEKLAKWPTSRRERIKRLENVWTRSREKSTFEFFLFFAPSLLLSSTYPSQIGQPVYARVSCRKTFRQTGMTRRKVGRRISVTIDGPDLRTSAGRRNRPIDNAAPPKGLENFARIYCRSSFEKLGNRNAWKINARHFSLLN